MAPDIANKLKNTLFRRRRRQSSVSTTDDLESMSPPTTPGVATSSRRPSFPFPREPSFQSLSFSQELMTEDAGLGIGGCGGSDDLSDAGDSAQTSNDADQQQQQRPKQQKHHHLWKGRRWSRQGFVDAEKRHSVPEDGTVDEDMPLASPDIPVSPTSEVPPTVTALSPLQEDQDFDMKPVESEKEVKDEHGDNNSASNENVMGSGYSISHGDSNDKDNGSEQQQRDLDRRSPAATTDMETASVSAASAASVLTTASVTSASTSAVLQQAIKAGEQPQALSPALDQQQLQRPHPLPALAGGRAEDQTPSRSLDGHEASRHQHQTQLDGPGLSVINSDQGTSSQAGTTIAATAAAGANAGADAARIAAASAAADAPSTGTTSPGSDASASTIVSAGPISGDLQLQRQQQKQAQKRPRQPAPPFPPALPTTSPPLSQALPGPAHSISALAPPTPLPSLPSLDSINEDESQSQSHSQQSQQSPPLQSPGSETQSQSQSQSPFQPRQEQLVLAESEQQQQQQTALPSTAAGTPEAQHLASAAVSGRGSHAPSSPDAGHGPLNPNPASPLPPIDAQQLPFQSPVASSTAPEPPSAAAAISATSVSNPAASTSAGKSSALITNASARPSAPHSQPSRDSNLVVTFDESVQQSPSARKRSISKQYKILSSRDDTTKFAVPSSANAPRTPGTETPIAVIVTPSYLTPPVVSANAPLHPSHLIEVETTSSLGDDFESSSMAEAGRKIWVTRPNASATLVTISSNDLVDDARDMILRKYANSLGKTYDSPDLTLRLNTRTGVARMMGPEEHMGTVMDEFFPNGQSVDEAFIIDIPPRRTGTTPRPSPRAPLPPISGSAAAAYYADDVRPSETGEGYFPPVVGTATSPRLPTKHSNASLPHSMAVISSGHLPTIPSPGGTRPRAHRDRDSQRQDRQDHSRSAGRNHTPSPVVHNGGVVPNSAPYHPTRHTHSRTHSSSSEHIAAHPSGTMPRSPGHEIVAAARMGAGTPPSPPQRLVSPNLPAARPKKGKRGQTQQQEYIQNPPPPALNAKVPPISVLIVEDNPINLKLLEAFVKRLKVRWQTAMNGRDAVKKWRTGGFHLVLMDIQLPGMNGLEATREIRRLERINGIGVFSNGPAEATPPEEPTEEDRLEGLAKFKSPVIIVALTASSLQSDRHEALAAGCNDFLTKPVNFVWLERKVMEWGCMQALIDYQGWREWKQYSAKAEAMEAANKRAQAFKKQSKKNRTQMSES
ncbi:hypothetical protein ACHAPE_004118 [Trichoderma viride]